MLIFKCMKNIEIILIITGCEIQIESINTNIKIIKSNKKIFSY